MKIVDVSVRRPVGVVMIVLALLALGFVSLRSLAIDMLPSINIPIAVVATSYQGAAPEEIENLVTRPLEASLVSLQGVDSIQSQSQTNSSLIIIMFKSSVNLDNALLEVREKIDQTKNFLPDGAGTPSVLRFDPNQQAIVTLGVSGLGVEDAQGLQRLQEISENDIVPYLERQDGVGSASIAGGQTREILVELNRASLSRYGLSPGQVTQALNMENSSSPVGSVTKGTEELQIRVKGEFTSLNDITNTLITLPSGQQIHVSDVASIKDTFKPQTSATLVNGDPALLISVMKQSDANTVDVANGVAKAVKELKDKLPANVELTVVMDTSIFIKSSINSVINNLMYGGIFAVLVLLLFLRSFRSSLVIAIAIPIAVISTFSLMFFTGQTLNIISMGGLALGVGMMVDSSIVILENIASYRQRGYSRIDAAIKGASELGSAVIASTTTTLVVFLPIVFVDGIASDLFVPMALTVAFSLIASLVVAITLVPMLSSKLIADPSEKNKGKKPGLFARAMEGLLNFYKSVLAKVLRFRKTTLAAIIAVTIGSLALVPFIGMELLPASGQGMVQISVTTPTGYKLEETRKIANQVGDLLQPYGDMIEFSAVSIGDDGSGFGGSTNIASFFIQMHPEKELRMPTSQMVSELNLAAENIAGADINATESMFSLGTGSPIQILINGDEQEVLGEIAEQMVWIISEIDGITNADSSVSDGNSEINIIVDRSKAAQYGLSYQQITNEVSLSLNGQVATLYREGGNEYDVKVIMPEEDRNSISSLNTLMIQSQSGQLIRLSEVAEFKQIQGPNMIQRQDQQRQVNVTADILGRDLGSVSADVTRALATMSMPEGYSYNIGGQTEDLAESFTQLAIALLFAIFLVYAVMAIQFESVLFPFIIMFTMPTTLVGVLLGLFVTNTALSISAIMGLVMLAGIVVNNGIILVDYINIQRRNGLEKTEAILQGAPSRVRPILMTTMTTVLGMLPMALGWGEGGETNAPMAIAVIFGLTVSSIFTLILIPVMYSMLDDMSNRFKRLFTGKKKKGTEAAKLEEATV